MGKVTKEEMDKMKKDAEDCIQSIKQLFQDATQHDFDHIEGTLENRTIKIYGLRICQDWMPFIDNGWTAEIRGEKFDDWYLMRRGITDLRLPSLSEKLK